MNYLAEILFIAVNILMAWHHANLINKDRRILHGVWAYGYVLFTCLVSYFMGSFWLFIAALVLRAVVFSPALNLFRKPQRAFFYVPVPVDGFWRNVRRGSIIDWVHYQIFNIHSEIYFIVYALVLLILNVFVLR